MDSFPYKGMSWCNSIWEAILTFFDIVTWYYQVAIITGNG